MYQLLLNLIRQGLQKRVPATGLGAFRIAFGLVILQEIVFLYYFRHLIFDPVPYLDRASPILHFLLLVWFFAAACLTLGWHTRRVALANYVFWVLFLIFTPMWQDFDGGFDQLMTSSSFLLIFLPAERGLSLDNLRLRIKYWAPRKPHEPPGDAPVLAYLLPVAISLGLIYFDSGFHKLSSEFWRNGMGSWLPPTMPYYMSAIDMTPLLNMELVERIIGYTIIVFQLVFMLAIWFRPFRVPIMLLGVTFHTGILLSLNIYPFGFGMLVHYLLMVPFKWWRGLGAALRLKQPLLQVYYDEDCPLCNRTVLTLRHFDFCRAVDFRGLQTHARDCRALDGIPDSQLLQDLYAVDARGEVHSGVDTYIRILLALRWAAPLGWIMALPGFHTLAGRVYRRIADGRERLVCCMENCAVPPLNVEDERPFAGFWQRHAATEWQRTQRIAKFLVLVLVLQANSTIHYAFLYRWAEQAPNDPALALVDKLSNYVISYSHTFLGITPHALYMHDHFQGYHHILALSYREKNGKEKWLPFVNQEGRLLAPNWGRVQSMWANVAVTRHMHPERLVKFLRKITAYFAAEMGIDLNDAVFVVKMKEVETPMDWVYDLRHKNMAAPWQDIGTVEWKGRTMRLELPRRNTLDISSH